MSFILTIILILEIFLLNCQTDVLIVFITQTLFSIAYSVLAEFILELGVLGSILNSLTFVPNS